MVSRLLIDRHMEWTRGNFSQLYVFSKCACGEAFPYILSPADMAGFYKKIISVWGRWSTSQNEGSVYLVKVLVRTSGGIFEPSLIMLPSTMK